MKQDIQAFDYAGQICKALPGGVLLTTKANGQLNTMTIGWGHIGVEWGKPIFVAYVRESRYSHSLLEENGEFTVSIPIEVADKAIVGYCGRVSGRDTDKINALGLHPEQPRSISVPGIRELPLTLECKVIYRQLQDITAVPQEILEHYYPEGADGQRDVHVAYYGEILDAYIITE